MSQPESGASNAMTTISEIPTNDFSAQIRTPPDGHQSGALTPDVLFIHDVARILRTSRSTIERRRRAGSFPIPELLSIDERPRWSRLAVERYLASTSGGMRARRGRPSRQTRGQ